MQILSFDEILTFLCDSFDALIAPKKMARSNANILYLIFKALAKGGEVINNVCVVLSNKFDPRYCSSEDLESTAYIVGTERYTGSASGLHITVTNNGEDTVTLYAGIYTYVLDDDTTFEFEVLSDTLIVAGGSVSYIAMSEEIGSYEVTEQSDITVESEQTISEDLTFSCTDNSSLLGTSEETDLEFRKRIITRTDRQNAFIELEDELKSLPYIFDCRIKFNNTLGNEIYDGITIPAFTALICYSGELKSELAEKVCAKILCPTLQTGTSVGITYNNDVFINGSHTVYFTPFNKTEFGIEVIYRVNDIYISNYEAQKAIRTTLFNHFVSEVHVDYIKEDEVYELIDSLGLSGIEILGINLSQGSSNVDYISVPKTRIPELTQVTFTQE